MAYIIVGLGNPGVEYENTRHNTGRIIAEKLGYRVLDDYMNNSGKLVAKLIKSKKDIAKLVVIHDDLDIPIGKFKISFNKSAGGHRGVSSVVRAIKSQEFTRIRVGISPSTPSGKLKKPMGEKKVLEFILGKFKPKELEVLKKLTKKIGEAVSLIESGDIAIAQNKFN
ncbi:MAG TPA: aminoacyl-tRNA hydrolase [Candidatus Paceibacterota bacterium]